ncbi:MAG: glycosyltransferase [Muribaculaceae bacterium]
MKQRVLIVNKFYYNRGGDCIAAINLENLLRANGYEVAFFAMNYPENFASHYTPYFASQVEFSGTLVRKISAAKRIFGYGDVADHFEKIICDFRPDVVHLNNIHSYLSPIVAKIAKRHRCRVVWTMHDYKLLCPSYSCLRDNANCELCFHSKSRVLKLRCMKNSLAASALAYLEALRWNRKVLQRYTDVFICPSRFMALKMTSGGFNPDKLKVLCNFVDPVKLERFRNAPAANRQPYYCYVGRLSQEKGVTTMLQAASQLPYELRVAGDGPLADQLRSHYAHCANIKFLGRLDADGVSSLLNEALFSVIPSECYENNPLGVIESLCAGTPVVGARNGGIPELINQKSGIIFTPKDVDDLINAITQAFSHPWNHSAIKADALRLFSPEQHLSQLKSIYEQS